MKRTIYDCWNCCHRNSDNPYGIDYCEVHDTRCSFAHDDCDDFDPDTYTGGNDIQTEPPCRLTLIGWYLLAIVFAVLLGWLLMGCTTTKYVPMPEYHNDTTYITKQQHDSIWLHDSTYIHDRGDTVLIERWRTKYVEHAKTDTLYTHITDSVTVPYPMPATLSRWQRFCCDYGKLMVGATAAMLLALIFVIVRRIRSPTL